MTTAQKIASNGDDAPILGAMIAAAAFGQFPRLGFLKRAPAMDRSASHRKLSPFGLNRLPDTSNTMHEACEQKGRRLSLPSISYLPPPTVCWTTTAQSPRPPARISGSGAIAPCANRRTPSFFSRPFLSREDGSFAQNRCTARAQNRDKRKQGPPTMS